MHVDALTTLKRHADWQVRACRDAAEKAQRDLAAAEREQQRVNELVRSQRKLRVVE